MFSDGNGRGGGCTVKNASAARAFPLLYQGKNLLLDIKGNFTLYIRKISHSKFTDIELNVPYLF